MRLPRRGGSLDQLGNGQIRRTLKTPVRLGTNGVYYVSYLFNSPGKKGGDKIRLSLCSSEATLPSEGWMRLHFGKYKSDFVFGYLAGRRFTTRLPLDKKPTYLLAGCQDRRLPRGAGSDVCDRLPSRSAG